LEKVVLPLCQPEAMYLMMSSIPKQFQQTRLLLTWGLESPQQRLKVVLVVLDTLLNDVILLHAMDPFYNHWPVSRLRMIQTAPVLLGLWSRSLLHRVTMMTLRAYNDGLACNSKQKMKATQISSCLLTSQLLLQEVEARRAVVQLPMQLPPLFSIACDPCDVSLPAAIINRSSTARHDCFASKSVTVLSCFESWCAA